VRIDERVARCFAHLRAPEFIALTDYFRAARQECLEKMARVNETELIYRLQGEAGAYEELLEYVEGAEALLTKLKR
jgi:hypothetical protein